MGADKAFLRDKEGRLLLASLTEKLANWFGAVYLIADRKDKFAASPELTCPVLLDLYPGTGPVGAILTALTTMPLRVFFVLAGDQPTLDLGIILRLRDLFEAEKADVALPKRTEGGIEPLYAFYGPGSQKAMAQSLKAGDLAIRASFPSLKVAYLYLSPGEIPLGLFYNLNTPKDAKDHGYFLDLKSTNNKSTVK
jgi:molybdopterin-guanine dinucleotide biosynthesis protein A